jgi:hypothetical protein
VSSDIFYCQNSYDPAMVAGVPLFRAAYSLNPTTMTDTVFRIESAWLPFQSDKPSFRHGFLLLTAQATSDDAEASGQKVWEVANQAQRKGMRVQKGQVTLGTSSTQQWLVWIRTRDGMDMSVLKSTADGNGLKDSYGTCSDRNLSDRLKKFTGMQDVHPNEQVMTQQQLGDVTNKRKRTQQQDEDDANQAERQEQQQHAPGPMSADLTEMGTALHCEATVSAVVAKIRERCVFLADTACDALDQAAGYVNAHQSTFVKVRSTSQWH